MGRGRGGEGEGLERESKGIRLQKILNAHSLLLVVVILL